MLMGMPAIDVAMARYALEWARERGAGTEIPA